MRPTNKLHGIYLKNAKEFLHAWLYSTLFSFIFLVAIFCFLLPSVILTLLNSTDIVSNNIFILCLVLAFVIAVFTFPMAFQWWIAQYKIYPNYWKTLTVTLFFASILNGMLLADRIKDLALKMNAPVSDIEMIKLGVAFIASLFIIIPQGVKNLKEIFEPKTVNKIKSKLD